MPSTIDIARIYPNEREQKAYSEKRKEIRVSHLVELFYSGEFMGVLLKIPVNQVPDWILELAKDFENDEVTLEQALKESRRISKKFKTPLSGEIIAEREEGR